MSGDSAAGRFYAVSGHRIAAPPLAPGLYVVATPIGNLGDITLRALATLAAADLLACEDTRVSSVLLRHYGIATRPVAYHDHNAAQMRPKLLAALAEGKSVALVSDAGTPLVSDPGYRLVTEARAAGHAAIPIPGASSVLAALVAAGLPTDTFLFAGFLPPRSAARAARLKELATVSATVIFFESPRRLAASLAAMSLGLGGDREATVARELTKRFETVRCGSLAELATAYAGEPAPKGEVVVLVGPPAKAATSATDADIILADLLDGMSVSAAAAEAAAITGLPRRELYARALAMRKVRGIVGRNRIAAERGGRRAEAFAAWLLRLKGYRILARRYRTPSGEIDLIARRGRLIAFVEVKHRASEAAALEAVTVASRRRIASAAALWLARNPAAAQFDQRFDVVVSVPGRLPRHIPSAFDAEGRSW